MKKVTVACIVLILICLFISGRVIYNLGIFFDYYNVSGTIPNYVRPGSSLSFLLLSLGLLVSVLFLCFYIYNKKISKVFLIIHIMAIIIIIFYSVVTAVRCTNYIERYAKEKGIEANCTLEDLGDVISSRKSGIIYFKRDDCSACLEIEEELKKYFEDNNCKYMCYSTTLDKNTRSEEMWEQLNNYGISLVPTLLYIEKGNIIYHYEGDEILDFICKPELFKVNP